MLCGADREGLIPTRLFRPAPLPWRLQAERLELLGPVTRQVGKTREADAARQAIVRDGMGQARGEEG